MEVNLRNMAYDVQDLEMLALIKGYHEKAMAAFITKMGEKLSESQKELLAMPMELALSNALRSSGGNARSGKLVTLNYRLLKQNMNDLEWIYVHELAHIVCQRLYRSERGHGNIWKAVNSYMGFEPSRTHKMNTEGIVKKQTRYVYHCGCMVHNVSKIKHNRLEAGAKYRCTKCRGALAQPSDELLEMMKKVGIQVGEVKEKRLIG